MDAEAIFDAFGRFSDMMQAEDNYRRKAAQITEANARQCGNCEHWMKTTCVPEKVHKQFKSCGSIACAAFLLSDSARRSSNQFAAELAVINEKRLSLRRSEKP